MHLTALSEYEELFPDTAWAGNSEHNDASGWIWTLEVGPVV